MLTNIKNYLVLCVIAFALGYAAGYYTKGKFFEADQAQQQHEVRAVDSLAVQNVLEVDRNLQVQIEQAHAAAQEVLKKVALIPLLGKEQNVKIIYRDSGEKQLECPRDPNLSVGAVSLLNDARIGAVNYSAALSDETSAAASVTRLSTLVASDIEIAAKYNDLAARHNELVSFVEKLVAEQNQRLEAKR